MNAGLQHEPSRPWESSIRSLRQSKKPKSNSNSSNSKPLKDKALPPSKTLQLPPRDPIRALLSLSQPLPYLLRESRLCPLPAPSLVPLEYLTTLGALSTWREWIFNVGLEPRVAAPPPDCDQPL
ncbi:hypothetical protein COL940_008610 [Colletotrichum noveboracense]|nr:hypothetical protein COL940_008610 [Colletotrichum noveboracense]